MPPRATSPPPDPNRRARRTRCAATYKCALASPDHGSAHGICAASRKCALRRLLVIWLRAFLEEKHLSAPSSFWRDAAPHPSRARAHFSKLRLRALQRRWSDKPEANSGKADARQKGAVQATERAGCVRLAYRLPPLLPTRLRLDGLTRCACPPPSTRATSCPGSGRADDLRGKLTGQGPRPRLVGEALHLPGERRHGRSAPLTLHEQETLWLGCGGLLFPPHPCRPARDPRRAAGGAVKGSERGSDKPKPRHGSHTHARSGRPRGRAWGSRAWPSSGAPSVILRTLPTLTGLLLSGKPCKSRACERRGA